VLIAVAFIVGAAATIAITGPTVFASNPASYIIVVMLMGALFIFFTLKDPSPMPPGDYGIVGGMLAFVIYLVLLSYAKGLLSFEFLSYRIDALLLPLFLLSIVAVVSGLKGIKRFAPVMAFLIFASPVLLMPILTANPLLSSFSSGIIFSILKATGANVMQNGFQIIAPSGQAISIASTAVPIGTFVALIMLLVPVSYLYTGKASRKGLWLLCGVALFFLLNLLRMAVLALLWVHGSLSGAMAALHAFGGAAVFYLTIIIMLLAYGKFGLKLELGHEWAERLRLAFGAYDLEENYGKIAIAAIMALAVLLLSISSLHASNVSVVYFNQTAISNATYQQLYHSVIEKVNSSGVGYSYLGNYQGTMLFELGKNAPANSTYLVVAFYPYTEKGANILFYSGNPAPSAYVLKSGITITSLLAKSDNSTFFINYFGVPLIANGSAYSANFEVFSIAGAKDTDYCSPAESSGIPEYLESGIYNLLQGQGQLPVLCAAERIALT
jgi:exosortase/archaeosortase family protein